MKSRSFITLTPSRIGGFIYSYRFLKIGLFPSDFLSHHSWPLARLALTLIFFSLQGHRKALQLAEELQVLL